MQPGDRGRVGERLRAALAGLQELQLLRSRQGALVARALAMEPAPQPPARSSGEQRLASSLGALKEQLSRLRRQDVGLKSHLEQLDHQISELKLDVNKASSEHLDSDSRPSSGFYELSDAGSCSLSNSCTSVYSESMSSSHGSLLPCAQQQQQQQHTRLSVFDCRPRSADETTVHVGVPTSSLQRQGSHLRDGCWIRTSTELPITAARPRPRPVSTGDLERLVPMYPGFQKMVDLKSMSSLCHGGGTQQHIVDPKYQHDLVCRRGSDVYPYPSPLHAVALQSPLFSLYGESQEMDSLAQACLPAPSSIKLNGILRTRSLIQTQPGGYINKLLQLNRCKAGSQAEACGRGLERHQRSITTQRLAIAPNSSLVNTNSSHLFEKHVGSCEGNQAVSSNIKKEGADGAPNKQPDHALCTDTEQPPSAPTSQLTIINNCLYGRSKISGFPLREGRGPCSKQGSSSSLQTCSEESIQDLSPLPAKTILPKKVNKKASILKPVKATHEPPAQTEFVHAQFVPAELHQVKVRLSSSKTKGVKVKRRNSEKVLRPGKQAPCLERPKGLNAVTRLTGAEWTQACRPHGGKSLVRRPTYVGEVAGRSCSESSLYPIQLRMPLHIPKAELYRASVNALRSLESVHIDTTAKRKQHKWQSSVEIARAHFANLPNGFAAGVGPPSQPVRRAGVLRTVSLKARSRLPHPAAYAKSESEYSAECASLFHSTIMETSEDEVSNYTTNRFGDSESSESESDADSSGSSLTLDYDGIDDSELVWAEASARLPAAALPPSYSPLPEPKICRIKASKALKKKIRRFQPASLKVMTMV